MDRVPMNKKESARIFYNNNKWYQLSHYTDEIDTTLYYRLL
jgi:hypothetical protein